jgi:hypothetical protein
MSLYFGNVGGGGWQVFMVGVNLVGVPAVQIIMDWMPSGLGG